MPPAIAVQTAETQWLDQLVALYLSTQGGKPGDDWQTKSVSLPVEMREATQHYFAANVAVRDADVSRESDAKPVRLEAVINTNEIDRYMSIVEPRGAKLDNYQRNPVLLWSHGMDIMAGTVPIGQVLSLKVTESEITAVIEFFDYGLGKDIGGMYAKGHCRAFSIGFIPTTYTLELRDERYIIHYLEWELVELSACSVPANPSALKRMMETGELSFEDAINRDLQAMFEAIDAQRDPFEVLAKAYITTEKREAPAAQPATGGSPSPEPPPPAAATVVKTVAVPQGENRDGLEITISLDEMELSAEQIDTLLELATEAAQTEDTGEGDEPTEVETDAAKTKRKKKRALAALARKLLRSALEPAPTAVAGTGGEAAPALGDVLDELRDLRDLMGIRAGAEFSKKNKKRITETAEVMASYAKDMKRMAGELSDHANQLRQMIEKPAGDESASTEEEDEGRVSESAIAPVVSDVPAAAPGAVTRTAPAVSMTQVLEAIAPEFNRQLGLRVGQSVDSHLTARAMDSRRAARAKGISVLHQ